MRAAALYYYYVVLLPATVRQYTNLITTVQGVINVHKHLELQPITRPALDNCCAKHCNIQFVFESVTDMNTLRRFTTLVSEKNRQ